MRTTDRRLGRPAIHGLAGTLCILGLVSFGTPGCGSNNETLFPSGGSGGTAGTGGQTGTAGTGGGTGGSEPEPVTPAPGGARRIIARQYIASIRTLLGDVAAAAAKPPADPQLLGLETIAATDLATPPTFIETYESTALGVAAAAVADPATKAKLVPCQPTSTDDSACMRKVVENFAPIAWRRALTETEIVRVTGTGITAAKAYGSFDAGIRYALSAILQSPNFLYIVEIGEPDAEDPTVRRLTPTELVTRISFFLTNSTPPPVLLDAAKQGAVNDEQGIRALAAQLVAQPEAKLALDAFYDEVYQLRNLASVPKKAELFPEFTPTAREAMRQETLLLIRDVVWDRDADSREIFDAKYTFVNGELAAIYGIPNVSGSAFVKVTPPPEQQRAGFLSHGSFLARASHADSSSPTRRGAFVQDTLLCNPVPPPPPTVNPVLPDDGIPKPVKDKLEQHMNDASCSGCHKLMDPIGFALEPFDAIGRYRTSDQGFPIDATGDVPDLGTFNGPSELATIVHDDPRSASCVMKKLYRHSMGHLESKGERPAVLDLGDAFVASGYSIQSLLVDLCASPAFRLVSDPK
jgi:hypothetical protein